MSNATPTTTPTLPMQSVEEYIASQPKYGWRRSLMRAAIRTIVMRLVTSTSVTGAENVPTTGAVILMMNHISSLDPIVTLGAVTNRHIIPMTKV